MSLSVVLSFLHTDQGVEITMMAMVVVFMVGIIIRRMRKWDSKLLMLWFMDSAFVAVSILAILAIYDKALSATLERNSSLVLLGALGGLLSAADELFAKA